MFEFKHLEVLSQEECFQMALLDAPSQTTLKPEEYAHANVLTYYVVGNTWILLWKEYTQYLWLRLTSELKEKGLITVIKIMQEEALRVIRDEPLGSWVSALKTECANKLNIEGVAWNSTTIGRELGSTVLMLLRYPKRFSPVSNDKIQTETLADFINYENRTRSLQRRTRFSYDFVMQRVREEIKEMYDWKQICSEIRSLTPQDLTFSSGAAIDAKATLGSKIMAIVKDGNHADYILPIFGVYTLTRYAAKPEGRRVSRIHAVPKSYKASRIIAVEKTFPIAKGKVIEDIFRCHDRHTGVINLEDQSINQKLAQKGSLDDSVATLDASHASDLISKSLFFDVFPCEYTALVKDLLPEYIEYRYNGREYRKPLQMASTSGHTLTFRHETIVYKAIAQAALHFVEHLGIPIEFPCAWAYGDDTIVSSEAYDVAVHFFKCLGLIINEEKSFVHSDYRESCGEEYLTSIPVTSLYYPRFPVIGSLTDKKVTLDMRKSYNDSYRGKLDNSVTMLIDLQKKLYPITLHAATFVAYVVQSAYPSITSSMVGSECNDLWDAVDRGKVYKPKTYTLEWPERHAYPYRARSIAIGDAEDQLTGGERNTFIRWSRLDTLHRYPSVNYPDRDYTEEEVAVYEYYKYTLFLRYGPKYEDNLLELLNVTQAPISISQFYGVRAFSLKTTR